MIVGYHLIWTAYGWWLTNDPRGSSSHEIRVEKIGDLGDLHYGRKQIQPSSKELREFYDEARGVLKHPLLTFDNSAVEQIAVSFASVIVEHRYTCYACAIMPDHVHMLIRRHRNHGEQMSERLQIASRNQLIETGFRESNHPVWGGKAGPCS
jgi:hypothetical protein